MLIKLISNKQNVVVNYQSLMQFFNIKHIMYFHPEVWYFLMFKFIIHKISQ